MKVREGRGACLSGKYLPTKFKYSPLLKHKNIDTECIGEIWRQGFI